MNPNPYRDMFRSYPDAVDFKQFKEMLGIGANRAYELLKNRIIPSRKNGTHYIIAKVHVIDYLLGNDTQAGN